MKSFILILFFIIGLFAKNVLILNSYEPSLIITINQFKGILSVLENRNDLKEYVEFMDTKQFLPTHQYFENFYNFLRKKYKNKTIDIVITTDDNALNFVRQYKNTPLFKNAKVFFSGVNNLGLVHVLDKNVYAGVFEKKEPLVNYEFAKKIRKVKTIYVLTDDSTSGKAVMKEYKSKLKNVKDVNFVYLNSKDLKKILNVLNFADPKTSVIFYLTPFAYKLNGVHINFKKVTNIISKKFDIPLIVHIDFLAKMKNCNIVGGKVTDYFSQGKFAGEKVLKYLNGTPMKDLGFTFEASNKMYLNVKNLEKFGINAYDLGYKNAIYVNKEKSFFEIYKVYIISFFIFFIIIIIFLIILGIKNRTLYHLNNEIIELNKSLEDKIQKRIEEIRKKDQILLHQSKLAAMGEMIGAIAHQWRQPLNTLAINIQMLEDMYEEGNLNKKILEEFIEKNMHTIQFMSNTIDDFKNFFRKDKEKVEFDIKEAIQTTLNLQKSQLKNHHINIETKLENIRIIGYKNEFMQVILNIISNAKDAIEEKRGKKGYFTGIIKIKAYKKENEIIIEIEDNGRGISESIKDRIFEPYFTTKEEGKGTGIGLYMVKEIVTRMKGEITIENTEHGAKFIIQLRKKNGS